MDGSKQADNAHSLASECPPPDISSFIGIITAIHNLLQSSSPSGVLSLQP